MALQALTSAGFPAIILLLYSTKKTRVPYFAPYFSVYHSGAESETFTCTCMRAPIFGLGPFNRPLTTE